MSIHFYRRYLTGLLLFCSALGLGLASAGATARASAGEHIEFVGCLPGYLSDTRVQNEHAYCATPSGLLVMDVSDPYAPTQVTFLPLAECFSLDLDADRAYIAAGQRYAAAAGGLHIVDISNPAAPVILGSCAEVENGVAVVADGPFVYVADSWHGLRIIDVQNPTAPVAVGYFKSPGPNRGLVLGDGVAYLADQYYGVRIIDISDPHAPEELIQLDPWGYIQAIDVSGHLACITSNSVVYVLDVGDPANPIEVGSCDTGQTARHIWISGDRAYLSFYDSVRVMDISDPTQPVLLPYTHIYGRSNTVTTVGELAYVSGGYGGLRVLDAKNPGAMLEIGSYGFLGDVAGLSVIESTVYLTGGHYYSGEKNAESSDDGRIWIYSGLFVIDLSTAAPPAILGYQYYGNAVDVEVAGNLAYVSDFMGLLGVFDVGDPEVPVVVGTTGTYYRAGNLALGSGHAYVVTEEHGLRVVDIAKPAAPEEIADIAAGSTDVEVRGNYAYTTDYYSGLHIVDIADPAVPQKVGSLATPSWAHGLAVAADCAYVACGLAGLLVVDISDPAAPVEVGAFDTPGRALNVVVAGRFAFVADDDAGLRVLDIGDPANPVEVGSYLTTQPALSVAVAGETVIVGTDRGGMFWLRTLALTSIGDGEPRITGLPVIELQPAYPNPFNPSTTIAFTLSVDAHATLTIYSADGRPVRRLHSGRLAAARHAFEWDGRDDASGRMSTGTYFYRLETGGRSWSRKMTLVK